MKFIRDSQVFAKYNTFFYWKKFIRKLRLRGKSGFLMNISAFNLWVC